MSDSTTFRFDLSDVIAFGVDLESALKKLPSLRSRELRDLGKRGRKVMRDEAPQGETGKLRGSTKAFVEGNTLMLLATAYYGKFVAYGTSLQAPNPFDQRTLDQMEEPLMGAAQRLVTETLFS